MLRPFGLSIFAIVSALAVAGVPMARAQSATLGDFVSATLLNFLNVPIGTTRSQTVTVTNISTAGLRVSIDTTGSNLGTLFAVDGTASTCLAPGAPSLAHNGTCTIVVQFSPHSAGDTTGSLLITDNDPLIDPQRIGLHGVSVGQSAVSVALPPQVSVPDAGGPLPITAANLSNRFSSTELSGGISGNLVGLVPQGSYGLGVEVADCRGIDPTLCVPDAQGSLRRPRHQVSVLDFSLQQDTSLSLSLPTQSVQLHVQDANGLAVPGAYVTAQGGRVTLAEPAPLGQAFASTSYPKLPSSTANPAAPPWTSALRTGPDGNAVLHLLPLATANHDGYSIEAAAPGATGRASNIIVQAGSAQLLTITLTPTVALSLSGSVTDARSGELLHLTNGVLESAAASEQFSPSSVSPGDVVAIAAPGAYTLHLLSLDCRLTGVADCAPLATLAPSLTITAGLNLTHSSRLDVSVPIRPLQVLVHDTLGKPVSGVYLEVAANQVVRVTSLGPDLDSITAPAARHALLSYPSEPRPVSDPSGLFTSMQRVSAIRTRADGTAQLNLVPGGPYVIQAIRNGIAQRVEGVVVNDGANPTLIITGDWHSATVTLATRTTEGRLIENPEVNGGINRQVAFQSSPTNPNQLLAFVDPADSFYALYARVSGCAPGDQPDICPRHFVSAEFDVTPLGADLTLALTPRRLPVRVQDASGQPVSGVYLATVGPSVALDGAGPGFSGSARGASVYPLVEQTLTNPDGTSNKLSLSAARTGQTGSADLFLLPDGPDDKPYTIQALYNGLVYSASVFVSRRGPLQLTITIGQAFNRAPLVPDTGGPYSATFGTPVTFNGSASDPDGDALAYAWDIGGSGTFTPGQHLSVTPLAVGSSAVVLRVCDPFNHCSVASTTLTVTDPGGGGDGGGGGGPINPGATPELDSLLLFGSGASGLLSYALLRRRARRGPED